MTAGWGGFAEGLANGISMAQQVRGMKRRKELDAQDDARFKAWQDDRARTADTQRQEAEFADQMRNGTINNEQTAAKLNSSQPQGEGAYQWTPQQVGALSRGPGSAFDPNAGPALPAVRTPMTAQERYAGVGALAMRKGDYNAAMAASDKAGEIQEDQDVAAALKHANDPEYIKRMTGRYNDSNLPILVGATDKKGYTKLTVHTPGSTEPAREVMLSPSDRMNIAAGDALIGMGKASKAMAYFDKVDKSVREAIGLFNDATTKGATVNNAAQSAENTDAYRQSELGIRRQQLGMEGARLALAQQQARKGDAVQLVDKDGNAHLFYLPTNTKSGEVVLPPGMKFASQKPQINEAAVQKYVEGMVGQPMTTADGRPIAGPDGKPRRFDAMSARQYVLQSMGVGGQADQGGLAVPPSDARAKAIAALPGRAQAPAPAPAQGDNTVFGIRPRRVQTGDDIARQQGWQPAGRGNAIFGEGETLYVNPQTGEKRWASSFEQ